MYIYLFVLSYLIFGCFTVIVYCFVFLLKFLNLFCKAPLGFWILAPYKLFVIVIIRKMIQIDII